MPPNYISRPSPDAATGYPSWCFTGLPAVDPPAWPDHAGSSVIARWKPRASKKPACPSTGGVLPWGAAFTSQRAVLRIALGADPVRAALQAVDDGVELGAAE